MMNGIPPGTHPSFQNMHAAGPTAMAAAAARQMQMRQLQQQGTIPPGAALNQLQFQQMQPPMHPSQLQSIQLQAAQQANPGMRLNPQHQGIQPQHLMQQQGMPAPMQHMGGQQVPQQMMVPRYVHLHGFDKAAITWLFNGLSSFPGSSAVTGPGARN
jgi:hypothetical protein